MQSALSWFWTRVTVSITPRVPPCRITVLLQFNLKEGYKIIHTSQGSICPKVNLFAQGDLGFAYYDAAIQYVNRYTTGTLPLFIHQNNLFSFNIYIYIVCVCVCVDTKFRIF